MFEQAVLNAAPVRPWAVTAGFACQLMVAAGALMIPLLFPQLLPRAEMMTWLSAPTPPPAPVREAARARPTKVWNPNATLWLGPAPIHESALSIDAPPAEITGVEGGTGGWGRSLDVALGAVLRAVTPAPPVAVKETPPATPKPAVPDSAPLRVSGPVQAARLIHRVEPAYPALARQMRVSGTVELSGLIGADGRIRELHVVSGHPLLAGAALDAVRQWQYAPTLLNGKAMEVVTTITVVFRFL